MSITVTVHGENDAADIAGVDTGAVTEDDEEDSVGGQLTIDDVDGEDEESFNAQTIGGVYGSLDIDADGNWTYTLDNDDPDTDALNDGDGLLSATEQAAGRESVRASLAQLAAAHVVEARQPAHDHVGVDVEVAADDHRRDGDHGPVAVGR